MPNLKWLRASAVMSFLALGLAAQDATQGRQAKAPEPAPAEAVKIEAHSSRWDYPKELVVPPGKGLHIVVRGDTLWDLAGKNLGNPYSWPQIWELNKWIKDPHWIYPGDPLLIDGARTTMAQASPDSPNGSKPAQTAKGGTAAQATAGGETTASTLTEGTPDLAEPEVANLKPDRQGRSPLRVMREELAFSFHDFIQMPFLAPKGAVAYFRDIRALKIVGNKEEEREILGETELVYLNGGADKGVKVGDRLVVIQQAAANLYRPYNPGRHHPLGDVLQQVGVIRVVTVHPRGSVAVVEKAMDPVQVGQYAAPFQEPANIPLKLRTDIQSPIQVKDLARIIYAQDDHKHTGNGEMIIVDKGSNDGLQVGDMLLALRYRTFPVTDSRQEKSRVMERTNHYLGQAIVVHTSAATATCRIVRSTDAFAIGDVLTR